MKGQIFFNICSILFRISKDNKDKLKLSFMLMVVKLTKFLFSGMKCWKQREMKRSLKVRQVFIQQHQAIRKTWLKGKLFYNKHRESYFRGKSIWHQVIFKYYFPHYCFRKCGILWRSFFVYLFWSLFLLLLVK